MDYFELYNIPSNLKIDKLVLKKKYLELSKKYHPDFFNENEGLSAEENLRMSALVNDAYKTLQNEQQRLGYFLAINGIIKPEEKYQLPSSFLMEVMEINEEWDETANAKVTNIEMHITEGVKHLLQLDDWQRLTDAELAELKEYYYKKKYLYRLHNRAAGNEVEL